MVPYCGILYYSIVYHSMASSIPYHTVPAGPGARSFAGQVAVANAHAWLFARLDARSFADAANDLLAGSFAMIRNKLRIRGKQQAT